MVWSDFMVTTATKEKLRKSNSCVDLPPNSSMRSSIFARLLTPHPLRYSRSAFDGDSNFGGIRSSASSGGSVLRDFFSVWYARIVQECPDLRPMDSEIHVLRHVSSKLSNFHGIQLSDDYPYDMTTRIE